MGGIIAMLLAQLVGQNNPNSPINSILSGATAYQAWKK